VRCLVTGAAGFIGSHLCERLLHDGHQVIGLDAFTDYYPRARKEANLASLRAHPWFTFFECDLLDADLAALLDRTQVVFHLAGQPGVRASWGKTFECYTRDNVVATQRLLEAARHHALEKFVFASSSSVYGDAETLPTSESDLPRPLSPYGVSKLAAEHLCYVYWRSFAVPAVAVRYFTVYGPRQRPDMGFHRFLFALLEDRPIEVYGDGEQTRDFTYVGDAVDGTVRAAFGDAEGEVFNLGGGSRASLNHVLKTMQFLSGRRARVFHRGAQRGDVRHTGADTSRAARYLGYQPRVALATGLRLQLDAVSAEARQVVAQEDHGSVAMMAPRFAQ